MQGWAAGCSRTDRASGRTLAPWAAGEGWPDGLPPCGHSAYPVAAASTTTATRAVARHLRLAPAPMVGPATCLSGHPGQAPARSPAARRYCRQPNASTRRGRRTGRAPDPSSQAATVAGLVSDRIISRDSASG